MYKCGAVSSILYQQYIVADDDLIKYLSNSICHPQNILIKINPDCVTGQLGPS